MHPPHDEAIHEARTSVKKVRAIRDLIEEDSGRGLGGDRKGLRKVNRALSKVRDADVMLEMLDKLKEAEPHLLSEHSFARMRRQLTMHKKTALRDARNSGAWKKVDRDLRRLRKDVKGWRPKHRRFGALAIGIKATFRRGRDAMARANESRDAADFHEWRKHIKALWYALRLVEGCSPQIGQDVVALRLAERSLGDDHNIVVLLDELSKGSPAGLRGLRTVARRVQAELRRGAVRDTKRIYDASPGDFVRRLEHAWKAWYRRDKAARSERPHPEAA